MSGHVQTQYRGETSALAHRVPIVEKLSAAHFEQERAKIFRRSWLIVGHAADVPEPGSYFVRNLPTLNTSLLVTRGRDGKVRAFHNVCTHRGNKLVREGHGCQRQFSCGFHGWTFSPEGELVVVTDEHQFQDLDKSALGLRSVRTEVWEDLVFVNVDPEPKETLRQWLGELADDYTGYFDAHQRASSNRVIVKCNWNRSPRAITRCTSTGTRCRTTRVARSTRSGTGR
jgi:phenylpropionate dioxygenase-like ring-hydroxylating dioxygenase large terminal subunit